MTAMSRNLTARLGPPAEITTCAAPAPGATSAGALRCSMDCGLSGVERWATAWDALAWEHTALPTGDALWTRCFWNAFGEDDRSLSVNVLHRGDRVVGVMPLQRRGGWLRRWCAVMNVHTPYCLFALDPRDSGVVARILDQTLESADLLEIDRLHRDGWFCRRLIEEAQARVAHVVVDRLGGDHVIPMESPEAWKKAVSRKMITDSRRKVRRLQRLGRLGYEVFGGGPDLDAMLEACFELETRGWKGTSGSPVKADPRTHRFYTELARQSASAGRFALYLLRFDGRLIAYEYCLRGAGKIDQLKSSFDPDFSANSPGNVLRYLMLEDEDAKGEIYSYHFGSSATWKNYWIRRLDPLVRVRVFATGLRGSLGYHCGPHMRALLKRSRTLRQMVSWARRLRTRDRSPAGQSPESL